MATEKLKIILDAVWQGKNATRQAQKDVKGVDTASKGALKSLQGLAVTGAAALGTLTIAAKLTFDAMNRGAELKATETQFQNLTKSINSSADAMLGRMKQATRGLVSDADLIAGANEIMIGKLAKTEDAVVRLSAVSGALNWDMGVLAQTINNQSVLRLDNLGLAVEDVIPRFQELKKTMGDKEAFGLAVIEAGEKNISLLGDRAETAAGKIDRIKAALSNVKDEFDKGVLEGVADGLITAASEAANAETALIAMAQNAGREVGILAGQVVNVALALQNLVNAINSGDFSNMDFGGMIKSALKGASGYLMPFGNPVENLAKEYVTPFDYQRGSNASFNSALKVPSYTTSDLANTTDALKEQSSAEIEAAEATRERGFAMMMMRRQGTDYIRGLQESALAVESNSDRLTGMASNAEAAAGAMQNLADATGNYFIQSQKSTSFDPLQTALEAAAGKGANAWQLAQFGQMGGLFDSQQATEFMNEALMRQQAEGLIADMIAAGDIGGALNLLTGIESDLESGAVLAEDFFKEVNEQDIKPGLDTTEAEAEMQILFNWADNYTVRPNWEWNVKGTPGPVDPVGGSPSEAPAEGFQRGGPVNAGTPYLVGEAGPELFVPNNNGNIVPNNALGGVTVNTYTKEAAAVAMTMAWQNRRGRMGL